MIARVAERFRALGDSNRLRILMCLQSGPRRVGVLADELSLNQASVSKHLDKLRQCGVVTSQRQGNQVIYAVRDRGIFQLCDLVCGSVHDFMQQQQAQLSSNQ